MSTRLFSILSALGCIVGFTMIIVSFAINPAPSPNMTGTQLIAFGKQHHTTILLGGWLQAVGPFLIVLFALAIVYLAGATTRFVGWAAMLGAVLLMVVTMVEVTFFLGAANASNIAIAQTSISLVRAVQHLYSIVASPALVIPLGAIILSSNVLPRILGYLAFVIGGIFAILGLTYVFAPVVDGIAALSVIQYVAELWFPVTAIVLIVQVVTARQPSSVPEEVSFTNTASS